MVKIIAKIAYERHIVQKGNVEIEIDDDLLKLAKNDAEMYMGDWKLLKEIVKEMHPSSSFSFGKIPKEKLKWEVKAQSPEVIARVFVEFDDYETK